MHLLGITSSAVQNLLKYVVGKGCEIGQDIIAILNLVRIQSQRQGEQRSVQPIKIIIFLVAGAGFEPAALRL